MIFSKLAEKSKSCSSRVRARAHPLGIFYLFLLGGMGGPFLSFFFCVSWIFITNGGFKTL
ncbi:hypothetical protein BbINS_04992 [Bartonella bacilliformis INS]|uniref:Uncharacterized protein n=1 Tax=Bartonella bacilliformis INS TaxID=1206782 RepID=A0ABN0IFN0_BARBA|nr:hypothetical protein AL467_05040 [Bartonella bacilliformis]EKS43592.1 hypothetical protein BbINS_04992 [Bartonella bacilliformis INS]